MQIEIRKSSMKIDGYRAGRVLRRTVWTAYVDGKLIPGTIDGRAFPTRRDARNAAGEAIARRVAAAVERVDRIINDERE
jgi:hypothetical protein